MTIRAYQDGDLPEMIRIWNEVVEEGAAFPQEEFLDEMSGAAFFAEQTYTAVAAEGESPWPLYPPPQQYRALRPYLQRQLRGQRREPGNAHR